MGFYNKLKWILGILMVFVLIIATNLIDKNNFVRVRDAVVTIYEDRLVANDLIFEMLKSVQEKELAVYLSDSTFFESKNSHVNHNIDALISSFEDTKLTTAEAKVFTDLKKNVELLLGSETKFLKSGSSDNSGMIKHINSLKVNLSELSKIQLTEGNRQMSITKRALDSVELFTQIEIFILVFLAIVIQIIVMYNPKGEEK